MDPYAAWYIARVGAKSHWREVTDRHLRTSNERGGKGFAMYKIANVAEWHLSRIRVDS